MCTAKKGMPNGFTCYTNFDAIIRIMAKNKSKHLGDNTRKIVVITAFAAAFVLLGAVVVTQVSRSVEAKKYNDIVGKRDDVTVKSDMNALFAVLEIYYNKFGNYPMLSQLKDASFWKGIDYAESNFEQAIISGDARISQSAAGGAISYISYPVGCNNTSVPCKRYEITAGTRTKQPDKSHYLKKHNL